MRRLRSSTVAPVLGTLINFLGMKKVNTRGIAQAEKHVLMASLCYNLKKMLNFKPKKSEIMAIALQKSAQLSEQIFLCFFGLIIFVLSQNKPSFFFDFNIPQKNKPRLKWLIFANFYEIPEIFLEGCATGTLVICRFFIPITILLTNLFFLSAQHKREIYGYIFHSTLFDIHIYR